MSTVIKLKYSSTTNQPADDLLQLAEPAYSYASDRLFIGADNAGTIVPHVIGGKYFTDMLDHTHGVLTPSSAVIVDANSKIDVFNVDNLRLDGNTLSSTDVNGNITINPNGTGAITLDANTTVTGTLNVTGALDLNGQVTAASLNVEDLTANRVVLAGTSGEIQDSGQFTYVQGTGVIDVDIVGSLSVDNIDINGNDISTTDTNGNLTLTPNGTGLVVVNKSTGLKVATGTEASRPTAGTVGDGVIRYNETSNRFEGTVSGAWTGLGGVVDIDQDTYIIAEENPDEDILRFYTAGAERMRIESGGVVVDGNLGITANGGIDVDQINIDGNTIDINGSTIQGTGNASAGTLILDPAPAAGDNGGDLIIRGNLQVTGTTTTVNSTVVEIADPIMVLGEDTTTDSLDRGISLKYNDGAAKTAFFGWDRGVDNAFTFIDNGATADARFQNLKLSGSITEVDGAAPSAGQLLIGHGTNGDLQLATLTEGNSITITNGDASIAIEVDASTAVATTDIVDTGDGVVNYAPAADNSAARGAATFASEQFNVTSGHVVITQIEGGTF